MRNAGEKRLQNFITFFCVLVFALFCFVFVAVYKSSEIEVVYDCVATGKLSYNGYVLSGVVTLLLSGLALWLNRFVGFRREWTAMAFLPSALVLAFLTDIDRSFFVGGKEYGGWYAAFTVGLLLYLLSSFVLNRMLPEKIKDPSMAANRIVWRNLILFVLMFLSVGCLSGGDKSFRREALQYKYLKKGDIDAALAVGEHSPIASQQLSAQRAYLLSVKGELAGHFFDYPVYFGAEGLLPALEKDAPINPDTIYSHIGGVRNSGESSLGYLSRVASSGEGVVAADYYLTALLAERRLVDFVDKVFEFYKVADCNKLPKHYKEALVLYSYIAPEFDVVPDEPEMKKRFQDMMERAQECGDTFACSCLLHPFYGDTYWWYFFYGY